MVVMVPQVILKLSWTTLAIGARQLVVQEALEMMWCLAAIVSLLVHAQHQGDVFILGRGGNDDFLHRAAHVFLGVVGVGEAAGGFEDDLGADGFPGKLGPGLSRRRL